MPNNFTISQTDAVALTTCWRNTVVQLTSNQTLKDLRGFNIPREVLQGLLGVDGGTNARAYIACVPGQDVNNIQFRLVLVAVDREGKDILTDGEEHSAIYDFSTPCPNTCDPTSPLVTGI